MLFRYGQELVTIDTKGQKVARRSCSLSSTNQHTCSTFSHFLSVLTIPSPGKPRVFLLRGSREICKLTPLSLRLQTAGPAHPMLWFISTQTLPSCPCETGLGPWTLCWDLRPFAAVLQCLHMDTHLSSSNKIQRNYIGLKITVCIAVGANSAPKRYKDTKKPNCHF